MNVSEFLEDLRKVSAEKVLANKIFTNKVSAKACIKRTRILFLKKSFNLRGSYAHVSVILGGIFMLKIWILQLLAKPYIIDEAQFPYAAEAVANSGIPLYYKSDTEMAIGIWHSPFYTYSLGYWMRVWGNSTTSVRLYGILCLILTCYLIYKIIRKISTVGQNFYAPYIGTLFYISHYLVIQDALIPDIDGTILPLAFILAIYYLIVVGKKELSLKQEIVYGAVAIGFAFSTKLTTPFALVPGLFITLLIAKNSFVIAFIKTCLYTALGQIVFLAWWIPVAYFSRLEWKFPYMFTIQSFSDKNKTDTLLSIINSGIKMNDQVKLWVGIPTIALFFLLILFGKKLLNNSNWPIFMNIAVMTIMIWFVYNFVSGPPFGFAKYWNIPIALIAILIGWVTNNTGTYLLLKNKKLVIIPLFILAITFLSTIIYYRIQRLENLNAIYSDKISLFLILYGFILFIVLAKRSQLVLIFTLVAVIVVITYNISVSNALGSNKNSSSYYFGESGLNDVINWLKENTQNSDLIFAPKDVGLQVGNRYYEDAVILLTLDPTEIVELVKSNNVKYIIVRNKFEYSPNSFPESFSALNQVYSKIAKEIGDFQIWEKPSN